MCVVVLLGPIPIMVGAELFRQGPRPFAMSLVGLTNWVFTAVVALLFEIIQVSDGTLEIILRLWQSLLDVLLNSAYVIFGVMLEML